MNHPRESFKVLAALTLLGAAVLGTAPTASAVERPVPAARAVAEESVPSVAYLWAGSHTFDFSLDGGATTRTGSYQNVTPPLSNAKPSDLASGADVRSTVTTEGGVTTVSQVHRSSGDAARFNLPSGQSFRAATGWSVLAGGNWGSPLRVWRASALLPIANVIGGQQVSGIPSGASVSRVQPGGSVQYMAVSYSYQGVTTAGLVNLTTYAFTPYVTGLSGTARIRYNDRWFAVDEGPDHTLRAVRVGSPSGTQPKALGDAGSYRLRAVVGDHLVLDDPDAGSGAPGRVDAVSAIDGSRRTVLEPALGDATFAQDGAALVTAQDETGLWRVYHLVPGGTSGLQAWPSWIVGGTDMTAN
ncbi:hypothetical protein [Streptomyces sp. NPDC088864]|uniref:hypothetical protein n=1 Tax=Streptomyces sp. NPDC088864 TaxID=3365910 RepID=UPI003806D675